MSDKMLSVTEDRHKWIGGSDIPVLLGLSKYKTRPQLIEEKTFPYDGDGNLIKQEITDTRYIDYGNLMEPKIRDYVNELMGRNFVEDTAYSNSFKVRGNCDGFDKEYSEIIEIKTHGKNPDMKVYEAQLQLYLWLFGAKTGYIVMYRRDINDDLMTMLEKEFDENFDESKVTIVRVDYNEDYVENILHEIEKFWEQCELLWGNPEISEMDLLDTTNQLSPMLKDVDRIFPKFKEMENYIKDFKENMTKFMGENGIKSFESDSLKITYTDPSTTNRFDTKTFERDYPELYYQYLIASERKASIRVTVRK